MRNIFQFSLRSRPTAILFFWISFKNRFLIKRGDLLSLIALIFYSHFNENISYLVNVYHLYERPASLQEAHTDRSLLLIGPVHIVHLHADL